MRKFMLIAYDNVAMYDNVSPEQMQAIVEKYMAWTADIAGRGQLVMGEKLKDQAGKAITRSNGSLSITEGPYTEANEVVGGFWIVQCETEEEAVAIASSCPHAENGVLGLKEIDPTG
jgi:hypothetical protein